MTDHVQPEKRSEIMKRVRGKNTSTELTVRKLIYSLGYRYHLHDKNLPGKPDIVFRGRKKVIFVNGCFWYYHQCKIGNPPKSRLDYWLPKLEKNKIRDQRNHEEITNLGWDYLVIWQCELKDTDKLKNKIKSFLDENL